MGLGRHWASEHRRSCDRGGNDPLSTCGVDNKNQFAEQPVRSTRQATLSLLCDRSAWQENWKVQRLETLGALHVVGEPNLDELRHSHHQYGTKEKASLVVFHST